MVLAGVFSAHNRVIIIILLMAIMFLYSIPEARVNGVPHFRADNTLEICALVNQMEIFWLLDIQLLLQFFHGKMQLMQQQIHFLITHLIEENMTDS